MDRWTAGLRSRPSALGGVVLVGSCAWVLATNWSPVVGGHPSYPILYVTFAALGGWVVASGVRAARPPRRGWSSAAALGSVALAAMALWLSPFAATEPALTALERPPPAVEVSESWTSIVIEPTRGSPSTGIVFHPGARVDARAYVTTLLPLAEAGHVVVIAKEPLGIAFLPGASVTAWAERRPEIATWVVGGHSLGGVAAASEATPPAVNGLLLWASYPAGDISDRSIDVASVFASNDGLTEPERVAASEADLPPETQFVEIEGAVHAHFGDYGPQPGDGEPGVDRETAQRRIVEATLDFLAGAPGP